MRLSVVFRHVYWSAALLLLIHDLASPGTLLFGALTGIFHGAELYLAMSLAWYFLSLWRKRRRSAVPTR